MKKIISNPWVLLIARLVVGFIFISFGVSKIVDPAGFAKEIGNYQMVPMWSLNIIALTLPWIELISGLLLMIGVKLKANSALIALLLVWFIFMVAVAWARGLDINCGCSAVNPTPVGIKKILENFGILTLTLLVWFYPKNLITVNNISYKENV